MMDRIVREAESAIPKKDVPVHAVGDGEGGAPANAVIAAASCEAAAVSEAVAISCFTLRGETARLLARFRPHVPIVAFSPDQSIRRRLALYWGVVPKVMEPVKNADLMTELVSDRLLADGVAAPGDRVVLVYGSPLGVPGQTNSIRLHEISAPAERGAGQGYRVPI
jgi:pyruvate kinase